MAGLGFKDFTVGEVLTSADVDGYLMQQSVMRFADETARGSAVGTAVGTGIPLAEGMVSYLDDLNRVEVYVGTEWLPIGGIIQTVAGAGTATNSTNSGTYQNTDLSATITPVSTGSRIIVFAQLESIECDSSNASRVEVALFRDATELDAKATKDGAFGEGSDSGGASLLIKDAPATTSAVTYRVKFRLQGSSATTYVQGKKNMLLVEIADV